MLRRQQRLALWAIGAASGLLLGLTYWFAWGCRRCAADESPISIVAFFVVVSAILARVWGRDHIRSS